MYKKRLTVLILLMLLPAILLSSCAKPDKEKEVAELLYRGEKFLLDMDYEQALESFLEAIDEEPDNPRGYLGAAEAYVGLEEMDEAIEILQEGLDAVSDNEKLQRMLSELEQDMAGDSESDDPSETAADPTGAVADPTGAAADPTGAAADPTGANGRLRAVDEWTDIALHGVIFDNNDVYGEQFDEYAAMYSEMYMTAFGIRFDKPVLVKTRDGETVTVSEAAVSISENHLDEEIVNCLGKRVVLMGRFTYSGEEEFSVEVKENGEVAGHYSPNGSYRFVLGALREVSDIDD